MLLIGDIMKTKESKQKNTRVPKQKRSIEKKELIKNTALLLFSEKGYANVSTNEIAKTADVSIGSLYNYYPNKKAIYDELVKDLYSNILEQIIPEDLLQFSPFEIIKKYIKFVLDSHSYLTSFQKKITALSYQSDDFRELEKPYRIFATNKIRSLLEFYRPNLKIKDLSTASFIIHTIVESIVHELAFYPDEIQNKEKVINEFAEMLYNYLFKESL